MYDAKKNAYQKVGLDKESFFPGISWGELALLAFVAGMAVYYLFGINWDFVCGLRPHH